MKEETLKKEYRRGHHEQVERWARFVRDNPDKWKKTHATFIDALFAKNREIVQRLQQTPAGREKLRKLYGWR